ncbi:hypothetical protein [Pseudoalteromonas ardens]|uniref:Lipoprotein n=1 Tax=Pseudoalteromonas rubra TaxID=43658 RepID=A0A0L0ENS2_9GAMM|nr:hypothetical protein [Pseudoalteromonas sp. R96]KNC66030.1 hypothetical protein AC626_19490 [Pseudoalteromonas rubra]MDK1311008.1 hypothetical protein [Pseudoalteromonas sp. R96]
MKKCLVCALVVLTSGCATKSAYTPPKNVKTVMVSYQEHPDYGEVLTNHPEFIKAQNECETEIYAGGLTIGDEIITDRSRLNNISIEHMSAYIKNRMMRDLDINGAYHGANAAILVSTGETSYSYKEASKPKSYGDYMKEYNSLPKPQQIEKIDALQKDYITCMREDKKWVPTRSIEKNAETGEVITEFDLRTLDK